MERMTPKDLAILELEDDICAAHGMSVGIFAGPEPSYDDLLDRIEERVGLIPRYRQRLVEVPFNLQRPVWVDDPNFSLDFHVRHTALPERTSRNAVSAFVSRMLSQRLDRGKPLWELWTVSGLPDGRWALVSKVHYSIIDGVSGTDLLGLLADDVDISGVPRQRMAKQLPSDAELLRGAVGDLAFDPLESYRTARSLVNAPLRVVSSVVGGVGQRRDPDSLGPAVGPHRRWQGSQAPLELLRAARKAHGCSTTDVILAGFAGGVRNYLDQAGRPLPESIKALVPMSVGAASSGTSGQIAALEAALPIAEPDGVKRLADISRQTSAKAEASGAVAGSVLRRQDGFAAPTILGQGVRSTMLEARRLRGLETVAINVPGPVDKPHVLGSEMEETYPVIPLPGGVQIAMAAMSLGDKVSFGITSDWDSTKGLRHASKGLVRTIEELSAG